VLLAMLKQLLKFNFFNSSSNSPSFFMPPSVPKLICRKPKAARDLAANVFEKCIQDIIAENSLISWNSLMAFPTCFGQPPRTGRRHPLATQISAQLVLFQTSGYLPLLLSASKYKPKVSQGSEQKVAGYTSRKLANGDVRGAVGILASDATYVQGWK